MKARWWQGGLHLERESSEDDAILMGLMNLLKVVRVEDKVTVRPIAIVETNDQQSVVGVNDTGRKDCK